MDHESGNENTKTVGQRIFQNNLYKRGRNKKFMKIKGVNSLMW